jgi:hypothetical protein
MSGFLKGADFKVPPNLRVTTPKDLEAQIQTNGYFFPNGWEAKEGQECTALVMDADLMSATISAKEGGVIVNFEIDASACNTFYGPVSLTWKPGNGVYKVSCATDLSKFNGKVWGEEKPEIMSLCEKSGEGSVLYNATLVGVLDLSATGSPLPLQEIKVKVAQMSPDDMGCTVKVENGIANHGPCRATIQVSGDYPGLNTYSEVSYDQATSKPGVNMFTSGQAKFSINDWNGIVNYGSESATWTATGPKNAPAQGEIYPSP